MWPTREWFFAKDERFLDVIHDMLDQARPASRSSILRSVRSRQARP
jgi:hypothetical protein